MLCKCYSEESALPIPIMICKPLQMLVGMNGLQILRGVRGLQILRGLSLT